MNPSPAAALLAPTSLLSLLPVRGKLTADAPVGRHTWFGTGGVAETLFEPADGEDLAAFLASLPEVISVSVIGGGANTLVRDGGIPGVTIRLGHGFRTLSFDGEEIVAGAAVLHLNVALFAARSGVAGLEFLSGIPGTIGGGVRMNAGAHGREMKNVLVSATMLDRAGHEHVIEAAAMRFSYRHCAVDHGWIFVAARLRGERDDPEAIAGRMAEIRAAREASQPIRSRTGGSTFRNPPGDSAWRLIDDAGCRGLRRGGALVSPKHTNFLINTGNATAADLEGLGEEVRRRVFETSGILLEWEIKRVGRPLAGCEPVLHPADEGMP